MRCERYDTYGWGLSGIILMGAMEAIEYLDTHV
jgi:hypothetical protein